jgi:large subunit ribosomal protein L22
MPVKSGPGGAEVPGVKTNEREGTRAVLRHSRMSAYKVRQVLDQIRGQDVDRAAETLSLGDREAAVTVGKVLASAVANAVHNDGLDAEELYVSACYADEGSTLKRWRPRARGRATRIRKRTSHITIIVSRLPDDRIARRRAKQAASGSQRSRRVAGSRRRQRAETTVSEEQDAMLEESGEAIDVDVVDADVIEADDETETETEFDASEAEDTGEFDDTAEADDVAVDEDHAGEQEADEPEAGTETDVTDQASDTEDTDGGSAEEKGK